MDEASPRRHHRHGHQSLAGGNELGPKRGELFVAVGSICKYTQVVDVAAAPPCGALLGRESCTPQMNQDAVESHTGTAAGMGDCGSAQLDLAVACLELTLPSFDPVCR